MRAIWVCILLTTFAKAESSVFPIYDDGPRILAFADIEYGRLQLKVKSGTFTLTAYTPDSVFKMTYEEDDVHPLYTFRGDLRLNRADDCFYHEGYHRNPGLTRQELDSYPSVFR